jgi:hypothetical protein
MTSTVTPDSTDAVSYTFAREHGILLPQLGGAIALGTPVASGAFGDVTEVAALDGRPPFRPLVVKLYAPDTLASVGGHVEIARRLGDLFGALDERGGANWHEAMLALPFWFGRVDSDGGPRSAALMLDLRALGYEPSPFTGGGGGRYASLGARERNELALRFAERAALLEDISFVHGDLNVDNVLVHFDSLDVQIIDYDSGAVVTIGSERPLTPGKPDDCMPPEVKNAGVGLAADPSRLTAVAERWSIGSLVGYFLIGAHPGFFLRSISAATIEAYAATAPGWPEIDRASPLFTDLPVNRAAYDDMLGSLAAMPAGAAQRFRALFAAGLAGALRPSAADWVAVLDALRVPPVIDELIVFPTFIPQGSEVELMWASAGATHVDISGHGLQPASGSLRLPVDASTRFVVTAVNPYGRTTVESDLVRVMPLPRIESVPLPTFPGLALDLSILSTRAPGARLLAPRLEADVTAPRFAGSYQRRRPQVGADPWLPRLTWLFGPTSRRPPIRPSTED